MRGGGTKVLALVVAGCALPAADRLEQSFSGRWRIDTSSIKGNAKPTVFQVTDATFKRDDNQAVKADGAAHRVAGDGYVDEMTVSIENDHAIKEIDKIRGKLAYTVEYVVSADGNTLTWHVASYTNPDGLAVRGDTVMRRVGQARTAGHLISGTWQRVGVTVGAGNDDILKLDGKTFSWRTKGGGGYDAIIGGKPVKIDGDNSGARAQITRPQPDIIVETDLSAKGNVDSRISLQLLPDKKTIRASGRYGPEKRWTTFYMHKQIR